MDPHERVHLGIDLGTSSVKALVADGRGRPLGTGRSGYRVDTPATGHAETDPDAWWAATIDAVGAAVVDAGRPPDAIGLSGQMHGLVVTDASGVPLRPAMLWPDGRATAERDAYLALAATDRARLANPVSPGMTGPMLRWLATHEPDVYGATRWALQPKDWLRLRLTGHANAEPSDASATLLYDVAGDRWDAEVVDALGLDATLLPPLTSSTSIVGELRAEAAAALDLDAGLPVAAGAADTAAAAVGTGLLRSGTVQLTIGTGGQIVTPQDDPVANPDAGTHLYRSALLQGWYTLAATLNAGLALDWVRRLFGVEWDVLYDAAASSVQPDDPLFHPHLVGERTPYLDTRLRGAWSGLGLAHDRTALLRSALEGVAFALRDALEALLSEGSEPALRIAGGGSERPAWQQMIADVLERPLEPTTVTDASARGAALLSALAGDEVSVDEVAGSLAPRATSGATPRPDRLLMHRERFERYRARIADATTPPAP